MTTEELPRVLWDVPREIETERLIIRAPRRGDGEILNALKSKNFEHIKPWFPWAQKPTTVDQDEVVVRQAISQWEINEDFMMFAFEKTSMQLIASTGIHCSKESFWQARRFEIGYWIDKDHEGQGYVSEIVNAFTRFAFDVLKANVVTVRADPENTRSRAIPERLGFTFTGVTECDGVHPVTGEPRDTVHYIRRDTNGLPELKLKY